MTVRDSYDLRAYVVDLDCDRDQDLVLVRPRSGGTGNAAAGDAASHARSTSDHVCNISELHFGGFVSAGRRG